MINEILTFFTAVLLAITGSQTPIDDNVIQPVIDETNVGEQTLGAFGDPFISLQVGTSPTSGDILTTDGTDSSWVTPASLGLGSGSGTGNVATSSAETATYVPFWTSTGATPATLGSDSGIKYSAGLDQLLVTGIIDAQKFVATSTTATSTFAGGLAIETSGFVYDYSSNNVGIGTASPSHPLQISGQSSADGESLAVTGNISLGNWDSSAGDFGSQRGALKARVTDSTGTHKGYIAFATPNGLGAGIAFRNTTGSLSTQTYIVHNITNDSLNFGYGSSNPSLTMLSSGLVGIGTTTPGAKLSVAGSGLFNGNLRAYGTITGNIFTATSTTATSTFAGDLRFDGEIMPDGAECTVGQILKKAGELDWDCAADNSSAGAGSGNVATSTTETATYVPFWTSTGATPATLGSDSGIRYSAGLDQLLVTGIVDASHFVATSTSATSTFAGGIDTGTKHIRTHGLISDASDGIHLHAANGLTSATFGVGNTANATLNGSLTVTGNVLPSTNDIGSLGTTGQAWSDLFLASGGVIDFNSGDVTVTHSTNALSFAGGNIGIASTTPTIPLSVSGDGYFDGKVTIADTNGARLIIDDTDAITAHNWFIGTSDTVSNTDNKLIFGTSTGAANNPVLTLDNSYQVGVGTLSPDAQLDVKTSVIDDNGVDINIQNNSTGVESNATLWLLGNAGAVGAGIVADGLGTYSDGVGSPALVFDLYTNHPMIFNTNATERMRISSTGLIGIGDTTPTYNLDVTGNGHFTSLVDASYFVATTTTATSTFAGNALFNKSLSIPSTSDSNTGVIRQNNISFLHSYGTDNLFVGSTAGNFSTSGTGRNIGIGGNSLKSVTTGSQNVGVGLNTLQFAQDGANNVAVGFNALVNLTSGNLNMALGANSLASVDTGSNNVGVGALSGQRVTSSNQNVFLGYTAGRYTTGATNTMVGFAAGVGVDGTSTYGNVVAVGHNAGQALTTGSRHTIVGKSAGNAINTGNNNIILGYQAGDNLTTGSSNLIIGYDIDAQSATASNQLSIGNLIFSTGVDRTGTLISSGNIGIATTSPYSKLSVAGQVVAKNYVATSTTVASVLPILTVSSVLNIPLDGTVDADGELKLDTTSNQVRYYSNGAERVLGNGKLYSSLTYATTTAWTGTTTIPIGTAFVGETWNAIQCFTDTGTVKVSLYDGTNRMNLFTASTTVGTVKLITNNTFTAAEKRYVDIGTPASSPTKVSCTVDKAITAD